MSWQHQASLVYDAQDGSSCDLWSRPCQWGRSPVSVARLVGDTFSMSLNGHFSNPWGPAADVTVANLVYTSLYACGPVGCVTLHCGRREKETWRSMSRLVRPHRLFRAWFCGETVHVTTRAARGTTFRLGTQQESTFARTHGASFLAQYRTHPHHHFSTPPPDWLVSRSRSADRRSVLHVWFPSVSSMHSSSERLIPFSHPHCVCVATVLFGTGSVELEFAFHSMVYTILEQRCREWGVPLNISTVDFKEAFDRIRHSALWSSLEHYGIGPAYVELLQRLYSQQEGTVLTDKESDVFPIKRGTK